MAHFSRKSTQLIFQTFCADANDSPEVEKRFHLGDGRYVLEQLIEPSDEISSAHEGYFRNTKGSFSDISISERDENVVPSKLSDPIQMMTKRVSYKPQDYYMIREQIVPVWKRPHRGNSWRGSALSRYVRKKNQKWTNWKKGQGRKRYIDAKELEELLEAAEKDGSLDEDLIDMVRVIQLFKQADQWESIVKTLGYWDEDFEELKGELAREGKNLGVSYKAPPNQKLIGQKEFADGLRRAEKEGRLDEGLIEVAKTIEIFKMVRQWEEIVKNMGYWDEDYERLKERWNGRSGKSEHRWKDLSRFTDRKELSKKNELIKQLIGQNNRQSPPRYTNTGPVSFPKVVRNEVPKKDPGQKLVGQKGQVIVVPGGNSKDKSKGVVANPTPNPKNPKPSSPFLVKTPTRMPLVKPSEPNKFVLKYPSTPVKNVDQKGKQPPSKTEQNTKYVLKYPSTPIILNHNGKQPPTLYHPISHEKNNKPVLNHQKPTTNQSGKPPLNVQKPKNSTGAIVKAVTAPSCKTDSIKDHARNQQKKFSRYGLILDVFTLPPDRPRCPQCNAQIPTGRRMADQESAEDIYDSDESAERMLSDGDAEPLYYDVRARNRRSAETFQKNFIVNQAMRVLFSNLRMENKTIEEVNWLINSIYKFINLLSDVSNDYRSLSVADDGHGGGEIGSRMMNGRGQNEQYDYLNDYSDSASLRSEEYNDDDSDAREISNRMMEQEAEEDEDEYGGN